MNATKSQFIILCVSDTAPGHVGWQIVAYLGELLCREFLKETLLNICISPINGVRLLYFQLSQRKFKATE